MSLDVAVGGAGALATVSSPARLNYLATGVGANQPFSIAHWVRHDAVVDEMTYMNKFGSAGPLPRVQSSALSMFIVNSVGSGVSALGVTALSTNTWYHLGAAWDGSSVLKVVLNGVTDGSNTMAARDIANPTAADWTFGVRAGTTFGGFDGLVEHIAIWDAFLQNQEFLSMYNGASPALVRSSNLKGYWPCYQGAASVKTAEVSGGGAACDLIANANIAQGTRGSPAGPMVL